jgi:chemotaxis protein MotA
MDILSLIGIVLALIAILGGSVLKGSGIAALWNGAAFLIVIVGTFAASMLQTPPKTFIAAFRMLPRVFIGRKINVSAGLESILRWSQISRRDGLLGLEAEAEAESDPFAAKALQMLVDGGEPQHIRATLEIDLDTLEQRDLQAAKVFEGLGIYAPTLGIIGAVLGLISVMQNLAEPDKLGAGIATAFVATIYGIASANLFFLPVANKLKAIVEEETRYREMLIEGVIGIAEGENPRAIESRLSGFVEQFGAGASQVSGGGG